MTGKYIFTKEDLAKEYIDTLDFDPLHWLEKDEETTTMGDLFNLAKPCEDRESDRSIRYADDDVCFEISFEYLGSGSGMASNADDHKDWFYFYYDTDVTPGIYYLITVAREL